MSYKIYFSNHEAFAKLLIGNIKPSFPEDYELVAECDANRNSLSSIFGSCQSLDVHWSTNFKGKVYNKNIRSMSVGDIIEYNGEIHRVSNIGFDKL